MVSKNRWMRCLALLLAVALIAPAAPLAAEQQKRQSGKAPKWAGKLPITDLTEEEAILHALNRLAFGPRPGDLERVRAMGLEKWIHQQLEPEKIDDAALDARLEKYPTLAMTSEQLYNEFPQPQVAALRSGMTREEYQKQQEQQRQRREQMQEIREAQQAGKMTEDLREKRRQLMAEDPDMMRPARLEDNKTPARIVIELSLAKLTRAVYSERQLNELMADFWFNHFNVFAGKGADRWLLTSYERDVIRPNSMGKFEDLLRGTAKSPAMLFYLDQWMSADPEAFARMENELMQRRQRFLGMFGGREDMMNNRRQQRRGAQARQFPQGQPDAQNPQQRPQQRQRRGLNENYARELMELHTLGVDGGYTQNDIIEVARAFTGWTMRAPRRDPEFYFESRIHDSKPKTVLGKKIDAGGIKDGEMVLEMLTQHPNTAKFISTKLARRFVSDAPPASLVERMSKEFLETRGDIRGVMRAMIYAPEFWSRDVYRAKIKKPFELVASTARALNVEMNQPLPLMQWAERIGEPLYRCQPPTGYSDKAEAWVNTGALLNRLNFALALAGGRMRGAQVDVASVIGAEKAGDAQQTLSRAIEVFLAGQVSPQTRATLEKQLSDPQVVRATADDTMKQVDAGVIAGLVLGSPEFQRR